MKDGKPVIIRFTELSYTVKFYQLWYRIFLDSTYDHKITSLTCRVGYRYLDRSLRINGWSFCLEFSHSDFVWFLTCFFGTIWMLLDFACAYGSIRNHNIHICHLFRVILLYNSACCHFETNLRTSNLLTTFCVGVGTVWKMCGLILMQKVETDEGPLV